MKTLEMMNACMGNDRKFECEEMIYSSKGKFKNKNGGSIYYYNYINQFMALDWKEVFEWVDFETAKFDVFSSEVDYISENGDSMRLVNGIVTIQPCGKTQEEMINISSLAEFRIQLEDCGITIQVDKKWRKKIE